MKWLGCGVTPLEKRRLERLQAAIGGDHEVVFSDWQPGSDPTQIESTIQHVRWGRGIQLEVCKLLKAQSAFTALIGMADGMLLRQGKWWPLCASYEALSLTFTSMGQGLDIGSSAFVSGAGPMARVAIAALFKMGYRKFRITAVDPDQCQTLINDLKARFFGAEIVQVSMNKIVLLAGVSSVFVNTVSEDDEPELSQEVSYLNFMKRPGAIVDTCLTKTEARIMKEAKDSMIPSVDCWQVAAKVDALWAKWAFGHELDQEKYIQALRAD